MPVHHENLGNMGEKNRIYLLMEENKTPLFTLLMEQKIPLVLMLLTLGAFIYQHYSKSSKDSSLQTPDAQHSECSSVEKHIKDLNSFDVRISWQAAQELGKLGNLMAVAPLIQYLKTRENDTNGLRFAAESLAKLKDKRAIPPLKALYESPNPQIRALSIRALGAFREENVADFIFQALQDKNSFVRITAEKIIQEIPSDAGVINIDELFKTLRSPDLNKKREMLQMIQHTARLETIPIFIEAIQDSEYEIRELARLALIRTGKPSLPSVVPLLKNPRKEVRREIVLILGGIRDPETIPVLESASNDPDGDIARLAVMALNKMSSPSLLPVLIKKLSGPNVDLQAVQGLVKIGEPARIEVEKLMQSSDEEIRFHAAFTLWKMKNPKTRDIWLTALNDSSPRIVSKAMDGLMDLKYEKCTEYFIPLLKHESPDIRRLAAQHLVTTKDPRAVPSLIEALKDEKTRKFAAQALVFTVDDTAIPSLLRLLDEKETLQTRKEAVKLLGHLKAEPADFSLIKILKTIRPSPLGDAAAEALGQIKTPKSILPLFNYALKKQMFNQNDPAIKALQQIGIPSIHTMIPELTHPNELHNQISAAVLAKIDHQAAIQSLMKEFRRRNFTVISAAFVFFLKEKSDVDTLILALNEKGNVPMAEAFLNSGTQKLKEAAQDWAKKHGYQIIYRPDSSSIK